MLGLHTKISIHALRKESDRFFVDNVRGYIRISIHALRKESDQITHMSAHCQYVFQSTLSVRRATWNLKNERRFLIISIHALRKESDL